MKNLILISLLFCALPAFSQCAPLGGLGNLQWFDNNGNVLTNGAVYFFVAGSSTQTPTYSDSACTVLNANPLPFGAGARVTVWVPATNFKMVLCASSTDGAACSAGDILFSIDNLPGASSGGGGGGGAPFIDNAANPATSGLLRLAAGSSICWRSQANSSNLCISKDVNDVLTFFGGFKIAEGGAPTCAAGFDFFWPDSTAHRWKQCYNGSAATQVVASGNDIDVTDAVKDVHFGGTQIPLSSTPPTTGQVLGFSGTNIIGTSAVPTVGVADATAQAANIGSTLLYAVPASGAGTYRFSCYIVVTQAATTSSTLPFCSGAWTDKDTSTAEQVSPTLSNNGNLVGGTGLAAASGQYGVMTIEAKASTNINYLTTGYASTGATPMQYAVHVKLEYVGP